MESTVFRRAGDGETREPYGTPSPDSPEGVRGRKSLGRFNRVGFWGGEESELPLPVRLLCSTFFAERKLKTISSMKTQQVKSLHLSQNNSVLLRHFLFCCLCLLSLCRSRQEKSSDHFSQKQTRSPRRFRKERHFCCVIVLYEKTLGRFSIALASTSPPGDGAYFSARV